MGGSDLAALIAIGEQLAMDKLLVTAVNCLWIYDYILTLDDEIKYAWSGRKSWVFWLFIAIRYTPVPYIIWVNIIGSHFSKPLCEATKWAPVLYTIIITCLAQIAVTLRIYAVTGRNKLIGGLLFLLAIGQLIASIYYTIRIALRPVPVYFDIDLDPYNFCTYERWRPAEFDITIQMIVFDIIAFTTILFMSKKQGARHPGIPSLLDTIARDATLYFMLMCVCQLCLLFFLFFAPAELQLLPVVADAYFIPIMASRLMLSLKKASVEPSGAWDLDTMSNLSGTISREVDTLRFASRMAKLARGNQETFSQIKSYEGDIELQPTSFRPPEV